MNQKMGRMPVLHFKEEREEARIHSILHSTSIT